MCGPQTIASPAQALAALDDALAYLTSLDAASVPSMVQADVLRGLERAHARHTAARSRVLSAFAAQGGPEVDGSATARAWLTWQTRVSRGAAAGAVGWMKRLILHPVIEAALAAGEISASWAKEFCEWTGRLPAASWDDADRILLEAAAGGALLRDLAGLAEQMYQRSRQANPDHDADDGSFDDRYFRLGVTFGGAGRAEGDLTPECAAALSAVLESLAKKAGPEDTRTAAQRRHDALAEACRRLIAAGLLPGRAGQPTQIQVHLTLAQLRSLPGAAQVESAWIAAASGQLGWLSAVGAAAAVCDSTIVPVVTGHVDWAAWDRLATAFAAEFGLTRDGLGASAGAACECTCGGCHCESRPVPARSGSLDAGPKVWSEGAGAPGTGNGRQVGAAGAGDGAWGAGDGAWGAGDGGPEAAESPSGTRDEPSGAGAQLSGPARARLRRELLRLAIDAVSGPGGLAAALRANLGGEPLASTSLPLDVGTATATIPAQLRRAVMVRHTHCAFPGCDQPASVCDIHHIRRRADGGPTSLANMVPLCEFHHLIVIHRWGWRLRLNPDGTTTATSPDGRIMESHGPPGEAA
jgi:hypothetical protein